MAEKTFKISDITQTGIGDVDINDVGHPEIVEGYDKLVQDILEILLIFSGERDVPRTSPKFGSKIMQVMGYPMGASGVETLLRGAINDAIKKLKDLQGNKTKILDANEKISRIKLIQVERDNSVELGFRFFLGIDTFDKETLTLEGLFRP